MTRIRKYGCIVRLKGVVAIHELGGRTAVDEEGQVVLIPEGARVVEHQAECGGIMFVKLHHAKLPYVPEGHCYPEWKLEGESAS